MALAPFITLNAGVVVAAVAAVIAAAGAINGLLFSLVPAILGTSALLAIAALLMERF